jgi:prepilin-type N-terminal cleavage/methylation domain-containing protein
MILRKIRSFYKNQSGFFSLIEVVATLAVSGIIALGATMANGQLINQTVKNNDYTVANRQVLNAIRWISQDTQMAQTIENWEHFPLSDNLTLSWTTWDNRLNQVVYSVTDGQLRRVYTVTDDPPEELLIAQYVKIDAASSNCTWNNQELILTITGSVGVGNHIINVQKSKSIISRPNL